MSVKTNASEDRITFFVEYNDVVADLLRVYQFTFFFRDDTVEIYDCRNRRPFLRRSPCQYTKDDFFIGAVLNVYSRQFKLVRYADAYTQKYFEGKKESTCALIKPDAYSRFGDIIQDIINEGFLIARIQMCKFDKNSASEFYKEHVGKEFFEPLTEFMMSDVFIALELVGPSAISHWREFIGPTNSLVAREKTPESIRAKYGTDGRRNAVHGSDSITSANRELGIVFSIPNTSILTHCSCFIIKPHCYNKMGEILQILLNAGFEISALQLENLSKTSSAEFLEVYRTVVPYWEQMVEQLCCGPIIVCEIRQEGIVKHLREFVGPVDPEIAKHLEPETIRARYGETIVKNAVHCTDLEEDGLLECEYFFRMRS